MKIETSSLTAGPAGAKPVNAADIRLRKVCREFESVLVAYLLRTMRSAVPKTDLFGSKEKEEIFQSMLDEEIAKQISQTGSMKLGDLLYIQLSERQKNR